jgi:hypothetical protein
MKKTQKLTIERSTVANLSALRGGADAETGISLGVCGPTITTSPTVDVRTHQECGITFVRGRCTDTYNPWPPPAVP